MNKDIFLSIVAICDKHAERLTWAMAKMAEKYPFSPEGLSKVDELELAIFDQFIVRFSKLQDAMGAKLMPAVIELTYEEGELTTFIDKLNRLEKMGALPSVTDWLKLRTMRNQFAHDYPDDPEIQSSLLNKAYQLAKVLLSDFVHIKQFSAKYL